MNYNFAIFSYNSDYYKFCYEDVVNLKTVHYQPKRISKEHPFLCLNTDLNKLGRIAHRIHHSNLLNKLVKIPLKNLWYKTYFKHSFEENKPICFLFFGRNITSYMYPYIEYLKDIYPNSKYVCYFQDLIITHHNINISKVKEVFDLVISYDISDSIKYCLKYHPTVYSKATVEVDNTTPKSDIYFLGAAKNRLDQIYQAYDYFQSKNLKCEFYITDVSLEQQRKRRGIHFISGMSYSENLKHVFNSKCILEINQAKALGETLRSWEAITQNKKLITNNTLIINSKFYHPQNILIYNDDLFKEDEEQFLKNFDKSPNYNYNDEFSPIKLLEFISRELSE